jgi:hypothetical protein
MLSTSLNGGVDTYRPPRHFTLDDALARVGRQVRVVTKIPDVPVDTIGTVLAVSGGNERAMVLVEWTAWRPATATRQTTPLGRWFNRPDYEESLVEV